MSLGRWGTRRKKDCAQGQNAAPATAPAPTSARKSLSADRVFPLRIDPQLLERLLRLLDVELSFARQP